MKYFDVTAVNTDGTENSLLFDHVSEWSFNGLRDFFAEKGVTLKKTYTYAIDDRPVYIKDPITEEYLPNTGQVI
jgi:hypothetical protein